MHQLDKKLRSYKRQRMHPSIRYRIKDGKSYNNVSFSQHMKAKESSSREDEKYEDAISSSRHLTMCAEQAGLMNSRGTMDFKRQKIT